MESGDGGVQESFFCGMEGRKGMSRWLLCVLAGVKERKFFFFRILGRGGVAE